MGREGERTSAQAMNAGRDAIQSVRGSIFFVISCSDIRSATSFLTVIQKYGLFLEMFARTEGVTVQVSRPLHLSLSPLSLSSPPSLSGFSAPSHPPSHLNTYRPNHVEKIWISKPQHFSPQFGNGVVKEYEVTQE